MNRPCVLVLAGLDPTGGAGLQADIETLAALGAHACPVATALTVQNTHNVLASHPVDPKLIRAQVQALTKDLPIVACKIGFLGGPAQAEAIADLIAPDWSVVLDPVLAAGGGAGLAHEDTLQVLRQSLLPKITLLTPNAPEARALSGEIELATAARKMLDQGCQAILVTGAHEPSLEVHNQLFIANHPPKVLDWPRLPATYHGSGCTLASACAAGLAHGKPLELAVEQAQAYTWKTLEQAFLPSDGQWIPTRIAQMSSVSLRSSLETHPPSDFPSRFSA